MQKEIERKPLFGIQAEFSTSKTIDYELKTSFAATTVLL